MQHGDFKIGETFFANTGKWLCTDVGTRTITAILLTAVVTNRETLTEDQARAAGWFNGPPYAVAEYTFDEDDIEACSRTEEEHERDFVTNDPMVSPS